MGRWVSLLGLCALLAACGGDDGGGSTPESDGGVGPAVGGGGGGGKSGAKVVVASDYTLRVLDTGTGDELASLPFDMFATALHVAGDAVILGGDQGELLVADADTLQMRGLLQLGSDVEAIASRGGEAYVAVLGDGSGESGPEIVRVDLASVAETGRIADVEVNEQHGAALVAGDDLIVLVNNGFALQRLSLASETVTQRVLLGEDPSDPTGPRGEFYGYGKLAAAGGRYYVIDEYNDRLLGIAADAFALEVIEDVTPHTAEGGATHFVSDGDELYLTLADHDRIVVFDGTTGEVARSFEVKDGAGALAVGGGRIYVDADESFGDLLVLDAQTGAELGRVLGAFADYVELR